MDNQVPLPSANSPMPQTYGGEDMPTAQSQMPTSAAGTPVATDPLSQASAAIQAAITQTTTSPAERLDAITAIKANYIKQQFGVDINQ